MTRRPNLPGERSLAEPAPSARILVVDDQPSNIQVVGGALGRLGHEIIPAHDGPTALRKLALRVPDLILLDLLMPDMDGCEVCRHLQANPDWRDIPVIFLSAADDKELVVRALEAGGVDYVTKPFHHAELISRVRTQLALKFARDRLRQLAEDKDELLGILAHDLKGHLGGVQMSAQLLHDRVTRPGQGDDSAARLAANIAHTSGHLLTFVKEFLANTSSDHSALVHPGPLDLAAAAAATIEQYREAALRKQLTVESILPTGQALVLADKSALDQVLDNLISNALKFSPPGRPIRVSVEPAEKGFACRIQDHGPGFTSDDLPRMFKRYTRLSARPTAGEPSTGLGLSIAKKLVLAMNGEIACESVPGQGATFIIRLPSAPGGGEIRS